MKEFFAKIRNYKYVHFVRGFAFILIAIMNLKIGISDGNKLNYVIAASLLAIAFICFFDKKFNSREK